VSPELSWFFPFGLTASEIAAGAILCIFIYWGLGFLPCRDRRNQGRR
jgi:hypothetical protein